MTLIVDGINLTPYTQKNGYRVTYNKREGANSGLMLDGSYTFDLLAYKAVIEWDLSPLTDSQLSLVMQATLKQYVEVKFFDPRINAERTARFIPLLGMATYAFARHGSGYWKEGTILTLEEK